MHCKRFGHRFEQRFQAGVHFEPVRYDLADFLQRSNELLVKFNSSRDSSRQGQADAALGFNSGSKGRSDKGLGLSSASGRQGRLLMRMAPAGSNVLDMFVNTDLWSDSGRPGRSDMQRMAAAAGSKALEVFNLLGQLDALTYAILKVSTHFACHTDKKLSTRLSAMRLYMMYCGAVGMQKHVAVTAADALA
jgi:hypothetical protein